MVFYRADFFAVSVLITRQFCGPIDHFVALSLRSLRSLQIMNTHRDFFFGCCREDSGLVYKRALVICICMYACIYIYIRAQGFRARF